ncbi:integrase [Halomonas sp. DP5Y7-2]|nr:integrase [Halomonas sp. DP5Y7-2]
MWRARNTAVPVTPTRRPLIVAADGGELRKSSLDTAWQRLIKMAIEEEVITTEERFGLHDLKRRGITDTQGTRHDKQEASGHRSAAMLDVYDLSVPLVHWPGSKE